MKTISMNKIKYSYCIFAIIVTFLSCDKLNLAPEDYYGSNNFWNNEAQVKGFIYGVHAQLRSLSFNFFLLGEARGGLQKSGTSSTATSLDFSSPIKDQGFTADKTGISAWSGFYSRILNVNLAIKKIENECKFLSTENKNYYLGQLYGIRAFYYFWLYRTFGGVPIVTDVKVLDGVITAEPLYLERSSPKQTLDFIKEDVRKSEEDFGSNLTLTDNKAGWSKFATLMLKAEVYLWSAKVTTGDQLPADTDLGTAESALNEVKGKFSLLPKFSDVFAYSKKGNDEIIFALRFLDNEAGNNVSQFLYSDNVFIGVKYGRNGQKITKDTLELKGTGLLRNEYIFPLFQSFDNLDTRKEATFMDFYDKSGTNLINGGLVLRKFLGIVNATNNRVFVDDIPVYRYADVLLMLAEIENKKGGDPSPYLNDIRKRAYGNNYNPSVHACTNQGFALNELNILAERDKEFVFENKRWFDILRMQDGTGKPLVFSSDVNYGKGVPVLNSLTESHKVVWPVDINTLNKDPKLTQTPGY